MLPSDIDMQTVLRQAQEQLSNEMERLKDKERELKEKRQRIKQLTTHLVDVKKSVEDALIDYSITRNELVDTEVVPASTLKSMGFPEVKNYISSIKGQIDQMVQDHIEQEKEQEANKNNASNTDAEKTDQEANKSDEVHGTESESSEVESTQEAENQQVHDTPNQNDEHNASMNQDFNAGQWQ